MLVFFFIILYCITSSSEKPHATFDIIHGDVEKRSDVGSEKSSLNLTDDSKAESSISSDITRKDLNKFIINFNVDSSIYKLAIPIGLILYSICCLWFILMYSGISSERDDFEENIMNLKQASAVNDLESSSIIMDSMWTPELEILASIDSDMLDLPSVPEPNTDQGISCLPPEKLLHSSQNIVAGKRSPEDGLCHVSITFGQMETLTSTFERIDEIQRDLLVADFYASSDSCPFSPRSFPPSPTFNDHDKRCASGFDFVKV